MAQSEKGTDRVEAKYDYVTSRTIRSFYAEIVIKILVILLVGYGLIVIVIAGINSNLVQQGILPKDWPVFVIATVGLLFLIVITWMLGYSFSDALAATRLRVVVKLNLGRIEKAAVAAEKGEDISLIMIPSLDTLNNGLLGLVIREKGATRYGDFKHTMLLRKIDLVFACIFLALSEESWRMHGTRPMGRIRPNDKVVPKPSEPSALTYQDIAEWVGQLDGIFYGKVKKGFFGTTISSLDSFFDETLEGLEACLDKEKIVNLKRQVDEYREKRSQAWQARRNFWGEVGKQVVVGALLLLVGFLIGTR
jgi:hypothetical protein